MSPLMERLTWGQRIQRIKEASGKITGKQWSDVTIAEKLGGWVTPEMIRQYRVKDIVPASRKVMEEMDKELTRIARNFSVEE